MLCKRLKRQVSKMESKIKPTVPTIANTIVRDLRTFSPRVVLGASRPRWRSQRSAAKERSKKMVVRAQPTMNSGFSL